MVSREDAIKIARNQQKIDPEEPLETKKPSRQDEYGAAAHSIATDSKPWWKRK